MLEEDKYTQLAVSIYAFSFNGEGFAVGIKAGGRKWRPRFESHGGGKL